MRPLSDTLNDLIGFAEETVTRPGRFTHFPGPALAVRLGSLADEVRQADARPAENIRTTRAAVMMVNALEGFYEAGIDRDGSVHTQDPWLMLAGATLPLLRVDAWRAFNNEKQARGT